MKRILLLILPALLLLQGCASVLPLPTATGFESTQLRVECRNDADLRQTVMETLRTANVKDIAVEDRGSIAIIKAAYLDSEVPRGRLEEIGQTIKDTPGVIFVEMRVNLAVIRDFQRK